MRPCPKPAAPTPLPTAGPRAWVRQTPREGAGRQLVTNLSCASPRPWPSPDSQKTLITRCSAGSLLGQRGRHLQEKQGQRRIGALPKATGAAPLRRAGPGRAGLAAQADPVLGGRWARMQRTEGQSIGARARTKQVDSGRKACCQDGYSRAPRGAADRLQLGSKALQTQGCATAHAPRKRWTQGFL